jgi:hypothetical protein
VVAITGAVSGGTSRVHAEDTIITIPVETVVRGEPGSVHLVAEASTPAANVGATCPGTVTVTNQRSENPNSDLIITSAEKSVTVPDVEVEAFASRTTTFTLTLGPTIDVSVRLGPNRVFSGGLSVVIDCAPPPTTTTIAPTTTAGPTTTAAVAATTTTTQAAVVTQAPTTTAAAIPTTSAAIVPPASVSPVTLAPFVFPPSATLPATGLSRTSTMLLLAFGLIAAGVAGLIVRARRPWGSRR